MSILIDNEQLERLKVWHEQLLNRKNLPVQLSNGIYQRYEHPIVTAEQTPLHWR